jgi:hypothetical protein
MLHKLGVHAEAGARKLVKRRRQINQTSLGGLVKYAKQAYDMQTQILRHAPAMALIDDQSIRAQLQRQSDGVSFSKVNRYRLWHQMQPHAQ